MIEECIDKLKKAISENQLQLDYCFDELRLSERGNQKEINDLNSIATAASQSGSVPNQGSTSMNHLVFRSDRERISSQLAHHYSELDRIMEELNLESTKRSRIAKYVHSMIGSILSLSFSDIQHEHPREECDSQATSAIPLDIDSESMSKKISPVKDHEFSSEDVVVSSNNLEVRRRLELNRVNRRLSPEHSEPSSNSIDVSSKENQHTFNTIKENTIIPRQPDSNSKNLKLFTQQLSHQIAALTHNPDLKPVCKKKIPVITESMSVTDDDVKCRCDDHALCPLTSYQRFVFDTAKLALSLHTERDHADQELLLESRLLLQVRRSLVDLHDLFFTWPLTRQLALFAADCDWSERHRSHCDHNNSLSLDLSSSTTTTKSVKSNLPRQRSTPLRPLGVNRRRPTVQK